MKNGKTKESKAETMVVDPGFKNKQKRGEKVSEPQSAAALPLFDPPSSNRWLCCVPSVFFIERDREGESDRRALCARKKNYVLSVLLQGFS
jgi:hypothetical protein